MDAPFVTARLLNSVLIGLGDLVLISIVVTLCRACGPRSRAALYALGIAHCLSALFFVSPATAIHIRFLLFPEGVHAELYSWLSRIDVGVSRALVASVTLLLGYQIWFASRMYRALSGLRALGATPPQPVVHHVQAVALRAGLQPPQTTVVPGPVMPPFVVGLRRPLLVISKDTLAILANDELQSIIAHEVAHLRWRDAAVNVILSILQTVAFWHLPLARLIRRYREEIEELRDLQACALGGSRRSLASTLVKLQERCVRPGPEPAIAPLSTLFIPRPKTTRRRLQNLTRPPTPWWSIAAQAACILVLGPFCPWAPPQFTNAVDIEIRVGEAPAHCGRLVLTPFPKSVLIAFILESAFGDRTPPASEADDP